MGTVTGTRANLGAAYAKPAGFRERPLQRSPAGDPLPGVALGATQTLW
jgi:hypothetical protein